MKRFTTWLLGACAATALALGAAAPAEAVPVVFGDNFTCGGSQSSFTACSYWLNKNNCNGFVVQNTCNVGPCHCGKAFWCKGATGNAITHGVTCGGTFLFEGTAAPITGEDPKAACLCTVHHTFFCSRSFCVTPHTQYTVNYFTADPNGSDGFAPSLQLEMNGSNIGCPVTPHSFCSCGWQRETFTFCSGANTTEDLSLLDLQTSGEGLGNDFGVAEISVAPSVGAPEPPMPLILVSLLGLAAARKFFVS